MKHIGEIKTISLSPDGSLCVTGAMNYQSTDRNALVWDVPSLSVVGERTRRKSKSACSPGSAWDGEESHRWAICGGKPGPGAGE